MRQVLIRGAYLLRRPGALLVVTILAVGGAFLVRLPLFGLPGYELGEAMSVGVGFLGGALGIIASRQERRLIQGVDPRPLGAIRSDGALASVWMPFAAASLLGVASLAVPAAAAAIYAAASTRCDPFAQLAFYPLLCVPSALVASAAGVLCGLASRRALGAAGLYALLGLLSIAATGWPLYNGPQIYAYNHFAGYLPGPLYDEALRIRSALLWFRTESLLWAAGALSFAAAFLDMKLGTLGRPRLRPAAWLWVLLAAAGIGAIESHAQVLGLRVTDSFVAESLGGLRQTAHFQIFYPRGKPKHEVDRLARDAEFRYAQIRAFLGGGPDPPINLYLYRSAEQKQELVGAGQTQFAKPWRLQVHLNDAPFPLPSLKHELAHAMAAPFGSGPFRVTAQRGIWPVIGIVEGLAVAADDAIDELSLHQWAAAMRQQKLAPDLASLFRLDAFYRNAAPRAYVLAGSFLRYLADTYGSDKLRELYAHGDFQNTYHRSLEALAVDWARFVDAIPLQPAAVNQAFARFRRGSIFARPCAREVASLQAEASDFLRSDPAKALARYRRCSEIQPEEPSFRAGEAKALLLLDRTGEAAQVLSRLAEQVQGEPAFAAEVAMAQADLEWTRGRSEEAGHLLAKVIDLKPNASLERAARIKLAVLRSKAARAVWAYLGEQPEEVKLLGLKEAMEQGNAQPYLSYLLGRRLTQLGLGSMALGYLAQTLAAPVPESIRREAIRLKIEALYLSGDCAGVRTEVGHLPDLGQPFKASMLEWQARCEFEDRTYSGPVVSQSPFR